MSRPWKTALVSNRAVTGGVGGGGGLEGVARVVAFDEAVGVGVDDAGGGDLLALVPDVDGGVVTHATYRRGFRATQRVGPLG